MLSVLICFSSFNYSHTFFPMLESHFEPLGDKEKKKLLELATTTKPDYDAGDVGLIYLDNDEMLDVFGSYIKKHFDKNVRFERAWVHWMKDGGSRKRHQHSNWTYLYYLDIPEGDAGNLLIDGVIVEPIEGTHIMFPNKTYHSITPNNTKQTRWAFAAECLLN